MLAMTLLAYPLAVHGLIAAGHVRVAVLLMALLAVGNVVLARRAPVLLALSAALGVAAIASLVFGTDLALRLPPLLINLVLGFTFAASLRRRSTPIVAGLMRLERGDALPPPLAQLARRYTLAWCLFFLLSAVLGAALALYAPLAQWSLFNNVGYFVLLLGLLALQYVYRGMRYPQFGWPAPGRLVRRLNEPQGRAEFAAVWGGGAR